MVVVMLRLVLRQRENLSISRAPSKNASIKFHCCEQDTLEFGCIVVARISCDPVSILFVCCFFLLLLQFTFPDSPLYYYFLVRQIYITCIYFTWMRATLMLFCTQTLDPAQHFQFHSFIRPLSLSYFHMYVHLTMILEEYTACKLQANSFEVLRQKNRTIFFSLDVNVLDLIAFNFIYFI